MKNHRASGRPPSPETAKAQEKLKALAWLLDSSIRLPGGFRIGIDALLGLVPFLGDAAGVLLSGYIVFQAARLGAPPSVLLRMMLNVGLEGLIGLVPVIGDVFDAAWKANQRNVQLLGKYLDNPTHATGASRRLLGGLLLLVVLLVALITVLSVLILSWLWNAIQS